MLSEARARLANTQGKKAKRKARERQLEEARRLAMLQKRRELKAAGIVMRAKPKKDGMDYMADIPFEKQPAPGFYDVSEERAKEGTAPVGQTLRQLEGGKRKQDVQDEADRKKRQKKSKEGPGDAAAAAFAPEKDAAIRRLKEAEQIGKRSRLNLPAPQVGERELEDIVKIGLAGENARALVDEGGDESSRGLLGDYSALQHAKTARTPRTAAEEDTVMLEARNQRNRTIQQTPLLGDENTPLHESALEQGGTGPLGATPRHHTQATPNPLATPLRPGGRLDATPRGDGASMAGTPLRTPMRDNLQINTPLGGEEQALVSQTPRQRRDALKLQFGSLPAPKNDFELVDPSEMVIAEEEAALKRAEDAAERDERNAAVKAEAERLALERRSAAVKRGLPRPISIDASALRGQISSLASADPRAEAERLVALEVIALLEHDAVAHPVPGSAVVGGQAITPLPFIADDLISSARSLVHHELAEAAGLPGADPATLERALSIEHDDEAVLAIWTEAHAATAYDASSRSRVDMSGLTPRARVEGLAALHALAKERMTTESGTAAKSEKRLEKILGGYMARSKALTTQRATVERDLEAARVALASFEMLAEAELGAGPRRLESIEREVADLERRSRDGQSLHAELREQRDALAARCAELEDEVVYREAEALNNAAMTG